VVHSQELKYIIVKDRDTKEEHAIVFPKEIEHYSVGRGQSGYGRTIIAAGFFQISKDGKVVAWGESASLDIKGRGAADAAVIAASLYGDRGLLKLTENNEVSNV